MSDSQPLLTEAEIRMLVRTGRGVEAIRRNHGWTRREAHRVVDRVRQKIALLQARKEPSQK